MNDRSATQVFNKKLVLSQRKKTNLISKKCSDLNKIFKYLSDSCPINGSICLVSHYAGEADYTLFSLQEGSIHSAKKPFDAWKSFWEYRQRSKNLQLKGSLVSALCDNDSAMVCVDFQLKNLNNLLCFSRRDLLDFSTEETALINNYLNEARMMIRQYFNYTINLSGQDRISDQTDYWHRKRLKLLDELMNNLNHELSNPLFGIMLSSELLRPELKDEDIEFLDGITESIKHTQNLLANTNELFRAGQNDERFDLKQLISTVLVILKSRLKGVDVDLPTFSCILLCNRTKLAQIIINLISNAIDATSKVSHPRIKLTFEQKESKILLTITDNGEGIPKDKMSKVFEKFYSEKLLGTGIGLSICLELARSMNGSLKLLDTRQGASFELMLPYENPDN